MTAKEEIEHIIDSVIESYPEEGTARLQGHPIDSLLPYFEVVNEAFIRPTGWYLLSENDKVLKLIEWLKIRFEKGFDIEFKYGEPVDITLKNWVIQGINYANKILEGNN